MKQIILLLSCIFVLLVVREIRESREHKKYNRDVMEAITELKKSITELNNRSSATSPSPASEERSLDIEIMQSRDPVRKAIFEETKRLISSIKKGSSF